MCVFNNVDIEVYHRIDHRNLDRSYVFVVTTITLLFKCSCIYYERYSSIIYTYHGAMPTTQRTDAPFDQTDSSALFGELLLL